MWATRVHDARYERADAEAMLRAIAQAKLRPVIDPSFPMAAFADAFAHLAAGRHFGKVVIEI